MSNICNIFNPINKENGNFLLFSQYVEDISRSVIDSTYKVRPSRFMCMNFNSEVQSNVQDYVSGDYTELIPHYFQNVFENGIATVKTQSFVPQNFSIGFMEKLIDITTNTVSDSAKIGLQNYITYVGDIDSSAWEDGFADILLSIGSGSVPVSASLTDNFENMSIEDFKQYCDDEQYDNEEGDGGKYYIKGWKNHTDLPLSPEVSATGNIGISGEWTEDSVFNQLIKTSESTDTSFEFNTILVFYDIEDNDGVVLYKDIPLGMYFTGAGIETGIDNKITIKTSSEDAYGAGSGWSLRICTRFSSVPYGNLKVEEISLEQSEIEESISRVLSAAAETIVNIRKFADLSIYNNQTVKDTLAIFKNGRTNVPYVREVNGVKYWFVNGRNTEMSAEFPPAANTEEIQDIVNP